MRKKAQAAMEFLMTYGWAILVVLAAIGALAYLGILNPANWVSGRCDLQSDLRCSGDVVRLDPTASTAAATAATEGIYFEVLASEQITITSAATYTDQDGSVCNVYEDDGNGAQVTTGFIFDGGSAYTLFVLESSCAGGTTAAALPDSASGALAFTYQKGTIQVDRTLSGNLVNIKA